MAIEIATETRATLCRQLGLHSLNEAMDRDFQEIFLPGRAFAPPAAFGMFALQARGAGFRPWLPESDVFWPRPQCRRRQTFGTVRMRL